MGGGGKHPIQRGQALLHKHGHILHGAAGYRHRQVIAAGHQVDAFHLGEIHNAPSNLIKASILFGGDAQLNQGRGLLGLGALPIHQSVVAPDDPFPLILGNGLCHRLLAFAQHNRQLAGGQLGVVLQKLQNLFHRHVSCSFPVQSS